MLMCKRSNFARYPSPSSHPYLYRVTNCGKLSKRLPGLRQKPFRASPLGFS